MLQNITQICLSAHSCKGQADSKISLLSKNGSRDFDTGEKEELLKENLLAAGLASLKAEERQKKVRGQLRLQTAMVHITCRDSEGSV